MKKTILILLFLITGYNSYGQLMGGDIVTTSSGTAVPAPGTSSGTLGSTAGSQYAGSAEGVNGEFPFYIQDEKVFDFNGVFQFFLPSFLDPTSFCFDAPLKKSK